MQKKTKIVATIGPACNSKEMISKLIKAGMNVARLNFSHGTHEEHLKVIKIIRELDKENNKIAILQDIAGPKIRIGEVINGPIFLHKRQKFNLTEKPVEGNQEQVMVNHPGFSKFVHNGDIIMINDGIVELVVKDVKQDVVICEVVSEGMISSRKGISLPTASAGVQLLSEKDKSDIRFGIKHGVDFMAISFVRNGNDIREVKEFIVKEGGSVPLIAKIEKPEALENFEEILAESNGIMIARGDLGVEVAFEKVPIIQKKLIRKTNRACKPVITATQMLVSMVDNLRPTRAEATDVANAILDGTDAVMLSEETAIGKNPELVVSTMNKMAIEVEKSLNRTYNINELRDDEAPTADLHVAETACRLTRGTDSKAIVCFTMSGSTARKVSRFRPRVPVIALTQNIKTCHQLSLSWGINPVMTKEVNSITEVIVEARNEIQKISVASKGDNFVITAGIPFNEAGKTNLTGVFEV
ncbi:MAG: pyruvate kinase [Candidatus Stygibacter australis]|nr:pyruvate kinase [Candidatus Stygibacter australis]MDP8323333.1 pyruvate kinase [Candidatus Stygibacter australis]